MSAKWFVRGGKGLRNHPKVIGLWRVFFCTVPLLATHPTLADKVTLNNGQSFDGKVAGLDKGKLKVQVSGGYVAGFATSQEQEVRVSNIRTIAFDGDDDYYSVVLKTGETVEGNASELL